MPFSCASSRASAICFAMAIASSTGIAPALQPLGEVLAGDELHRQEVRGRAVGERRALEAVDVRDVGVVERGQQLRLALEAGEALGILRQLGRQHLDRDVASELRVSGAVDLPHTSRAEGSGESVVGEVLPDQGRIIERDPRGADSHRPQQSRPLLALALTARPDTVLIVAASFLALMHRGRGRLRLGEKRCRRCRSVIAQLHTVGIDGERAWADKRGVFPDHHPLVRAILRLKVVARLNRPFHVSCEYDLHATVAKASSGHENRAGQVGSACLWRMLGRQRVDRWHGGVGRPCRALEQARTPGSTSVDRFPVL